MIPSLLAALFLAATQSPTKATAQASPREEATPIRTIVIDPAKPEKAYARIRTAIGVPANIDFPEPFATDPACGDCGDEKSDALFKLEYPKQAGHYLTIKPRMFPGLHPRGYVVAQEDFFTNVIVRLPSVTITLIVELAAREKADTRVVFQFPPRDPTESAYVQQRIDQARRELEQTCARNLDEQVSKALLAALATPHRCSTASQRARSDDLVLELQEICQFDAVTYVRFTLENRRAESLRLADVIVRTHKSKSELVPQLHLPDREVAFRQTVTGVLSFTALASEKSYELAPRTTSARASDLQVTFQP